jgi:hypothetical protein
MFRKFLEGTVFNTTYVVRQIGDTFSVGFYSPNGDWNRHEEFRTKEDAEKKVNFLNGGTSAVVAAAPSTGGVPNPK